MIVEIIDRADVKAGGGLGGRGVGGAKRDRGRLVEYFGADGQLFRHLPLQQPAKEPIIAIGHVVTGRKFEERKHADHRSRHRARGSRLRREPFLSSSMKRYFKPSSVSPNPNCVGPPVGLSSATGTMM